MRIRAYYFYIFFLIFVGLSLYLIITFVEGVANQIGFISILVALMSIILVFKSDELTTSIARANFQRIISQLEDKRLDLDNFEYRGNPTTGQISLIQNIFTKRQVNSWKCQVHIEEAIDILKYCTIEPKYISRFMNLVNNYIQRAYLLNWNNIRGQIILEELGHILSMYDSIFSLETNGILSRKKMKRCGFEERKRISIAFIKQVTAINNAIEIDHNFIKDYKNIFSSFLQQDQSIQSPNVLRWECPYVNVRDVFNLQYEELQG